MDLDRQTCTQKKTRKDHIAPALHPEPDCKHHCLSVSQRPKEYPGKEGMINHVILSCSTAGSSPRHAKLLAGGAKQDTFFGLVACRYER
jgi:hypothetical protein